MQQILRCPIVAGAAELDVAQLNTSITGEQGVMASLPTAAQSWLHHNWLFWRAVSFGLLPFPVGMALVLVCGYCSALQVMLVLVAVFMLALNVLPLFFCRLFKIEASLCASVLLRSQPHKRARLSAGAESVGTSPPCTVKLLCPCFSSEQKKTDLPKAHHCRVQRHTALTC